MIVLDTHYLVKDGNEARFIVTPDSVYFRELWAGVSQGTRQLTLDQARREWLRLIEEGYRRSDEGK